MSQLNDETRLTIQSALDAFKRRDRMAARRLTQRSIALAPDNEVPWLFLAVLASPRASLEYVHMALAINPERLEAQQALAWAQSRLDVQTAEVTAQAAEAVVQPPSESSGVEVQPIIQPALATVEPPSGDSQPTVAPTIVPAAAAVELQGEPAQPSATALSTAGESVQAPGPEDTQLA